MNSNLLTSLVMLAAVAGAFFVGRGTSEPTLEAQGTSPRMPILPAPPVPGAGFANEAMETAMSAAGALTTQANQPPQLLPYSDGSGGAVEGNGILAVTGSYGVGTSVLYVIDTESKQLAVYEARGGSRSMRRLTLVGARRIDLDLQLRGYNDESEYQYGALEKMFEKRKQPQAGPDTVRTIESSTDGR